MVTRTEFESGHTCPTHPPAKMLATNLRFGPGNSDMESDSFFAEKEPEVWKKTAVPKFEDLRVARSMKVLLSRGQENSDPTAAASAGSKSTPASAGAKRRKSYVCQNKPLVFKVNPLYEPPVPAVSEDEVDKETVASPSKKRNVLPVKSPHTKEKEMVSAILQLAAYGMISWNVSVPTYIRTYIHSKI